MISSIDLNNIMIILFKGRFILELLACNVIALTKQANKILMKKMLVIIIIN